MGDGRSMRGTISASGGSSITMICWKRFTCWARCLAWIGRTGDRNYQEPLLFVMLSSSAVALLTIAMSRRASDEPT